jgi:hypothetical protein
LWPRCLIIPRCVTQLYLYLFLCRVTQVHTTNIQCMQTSTTPKQNPPSTQKVRFQGYCTIVCALTRAFQWALVRPLEMKTR